MRSDQNFGKLQSQRRQKDSTFQRALVHTEQRNPPLGRTCAEAGASSVMLLPPTAYRANDDEVIAHYREVGKVEFHYRLQQSL